MTIDRISTNGLADDAVSGAKIAMGADVQGDILYFDGTNYVRLPKGGAGQVLTMNASATAVEWAALENGVKFLDKKSVSTSVNSIDFNLTNGFNPTVYDEFSIRVFSVSVSLPTSRIAVRFGTGATPTYQSGVSDYSWSFVKADQVSSLTVPAAAADDLDSAMHIIDNMDTNSKQGVFGEVKLYGCGQTDDYPGIYFHMLGGADTSTRRKSCIGMGSFHNNNGNTEAITAVQFIPTSGTIESGTFALFGTKFL